MASTTAWEPSGNMAAVVTVPVALFSVLSVTEPSGFFVVVVVEDVPE